jgi:hypothetical protein
MNRSHSEWDEVVTAAPTDVKAYQHQLNVMWGRIVTANPERDIVGMPVGDFKAQKEEYERQKQCYEKLRQGHLQRERVTSDGNTKGSHPNFKLLDAILVYKASMKRLLEIKSKGVPIVLTSFRRAGANEHHQLLGQIETLLRRRAGFENMYFHCQSRFDNSLFRGDDGPTSRAGYMAGYEEVGGRDSQGLPIMAQYWYMEWMCVAYMADALIVFHLGAENIKKYQECQGEALTSSANCAIELIFLSNLINKGESNIKTIVVLEDTDKLCLDKALNKKMMAESRSKEETMLRNGVANRMPKKLKNAVKETTAIWCSNYRHAATGIKASDANLRKQDSFSVRSMWQKMASATESKRKIRGASPICWTKEYDSESGHHYYVHCATGVSQWEEPPGFVGLNKAALDRKLPKIEKTAKGRASVLTFLRKSAKEATKKSSTTETEATTDGKWVEHFDEQSKRNYYINNGTKESRWEKPSDFEATGATSTESERARTISSSLDFANKSGAQKMARKTKGGGKKPAKEVTSESGVCFLTPFAQRDMSAHKKSTTEVPLAMGFCPVGAEEFKRMPRPEQGRYIEKVRAHATQVLRHAAEMEALTAIAQYGQ